MSDIINVLENILNYHIHEKVSNFDSTLEDEVFNFFFSALKTSQKIYTQYPEYIRTRHSLAPTATFLGAYILHRNRRTGSVRTDAWLKARIQEALSPQENTPFFDLLLTVELPFVGIEWREPHVALQVLEMFSKRILDAPWEGSNREILQFILAFLARLRVHYPNEVDDFLDEQNASVEIRSQVRMNEPVETIGELIGQRGWYFLRDEIIHSPNFRTPVIRILDKAVDCKDLKTWLGYLIRELINQIYEREVL